MKKFIFLLVVTAAILGYSIVSVGNIEVPASQISVKSGASIASIPSILGIDISDWRWKYYRKFYLAEFSLKAGTYKIPKTTVAEVFEGALKTPVNEDYTITILPGWNKYDVDGYLAKNGFIKEGEFSSLSGAIFTDMQKKFAFLEDQDSLEGFLYPDTYRVRPTADLREILDTLLSTFDVRIYSKLSDTDKKKFYQTLILASIVEREERNPDEKARVAGVLLQRFERGETLGADATICYALALGSNCTPSDIVEGLNSASKYNTRKFSGFPPTPIANPSRETWLAALRPLKSEYYYYLHDSAGKIHYGRTLEEHNANKRKYLGR